MSATFAKDHLKAFVERVERLTEERDAISSDIRDVFAEAKGNGFDVKALRQVIKLRKQDADERAEQEAILETYLQALGMLGDETRARLKVIDAHGKKMVAEVERAMAGRAAQACAAAPDKTLQRDRTSEPPSRSRQSADASSSELPSAASSPEGTAGLQGDGSTEAAAPSAAAPIEKASGDTVSPEADNSPPPPLPGGERPLSLSGPGLCPGTSSDGADNSPPPSSSGEEQARPDDRSSRQPSGQRPDNHAPGGADDFPDMPPFLRRGPNNEASFLGEREARAPP